MFSVHYAEMITAFLNSERRVEFLVFTINFVEYENNKLSNKK